MTEHNELIEGIAMDEIDSELIVPEGEYGDDDEEDADAPESEEDAQGEL